jgi:hypothetical protein
VKIVKKYKENRAEIELSQLKFYITPPPWIETLEQHPHLSTKRLLRLRISWTKEEKMQSVKGTTFAKEQRLDV